MKSVRHFVNDHRGGLARYVERLVQAQYEQGQRDIEVYGPHRLALPEAVRLTPYRERSTRWGVNQWQFALQAVLQRGGSAIRHMHSLALGPVDLQTIHGFYTRNWIAKHEAVSSTALARAQFRLLSRLERNALHESKAVVFLSKDNRAYAEEVLGVRRPSAFHVIPQGVDSTIFAPVPRAERQTLRSARFPDLNPSARWLLFVGHDFFGKGLLRILSALRAAPAAANKSRTLELLVYGDDPSNLPRARELAQGLELSVRFGLSQESLRDAYALSDALVMDSVSEGNPLVLLEAMSSGCVPYVTRFGGVEDTITSGTDGWIARDAAELCAAALEAEPSQLEKLSKQAIARARLRSWATVASEYEKLYASL